VNERSTIVKKVKFADNKTSQKTQVHICSCIRMRRNVLAIWHVPVSLYSNNSAESFRLRQLSELTYNRQREEVCVSMPVSNMMSHICTERHQIFILKTDKTSQVNVAILLKILLCELIL